MLSGRINFGMRIADPPHHQNGGRDLAKICFANFGGGERIRTPETLTNLTVFKTVAFNRSATPPVLQVNRS